MLTEMGVPPTNLLPEVTNVVGFMDGPALRT